MLPTGDTMGDKSKIEWTDATWNPVTGCTKVSQGCKNCYAERLFPRAYGTRKPGRGNGGKSVNQTGRTFTDVRTHPDRLDQPLRWRRPRRIFVNSMSDLFHEDVPDEFIDRVFIVMAMAVQHSFQALTKRPQRMFDYLNSQDEHWDDHRLEILRSTALVEGYTDRPEVDIRWPLPNVWLGVSVEDQATADERIPLLLRTPAAVRFLSCEPLLGPISFEGLFANPANPRDGTNALEEIDWLIAGGESGPSARPSHPDWFRDLRDQCQAVGVPFFFKQWGEWEIASAANGHHDCSMASNGARWVHNDGLVNGPSWFRDDKREDTEPVGMIRVGKKAAGNVLDGRTWEEYPRA